MSSPPISDTLAGPRPFAGAALDRAENERKDPARLAELVDDPGARVVFAGRDGVLVAGECLARAPVSAPVRADPVVLGLDGMGHAVLAADLESLSVDARAALLEQGSLMPLREAGTRLAPAEAGLAAYLSALLAWHRTHRFCPNCGWPTDRDEGGASRCCPNCRLHHFPRTDPVVIMTVTHEDRLLLGRRAGWPEGRMSVLAGFVAPGESTEEAVVREVREESGIEVFGPAYVASQPWPFPASLMLGFDAWSDGGEPRARDGELVEVRWVPVEEVRVAAREEGPGLRLPPPVSIARFLIDRWMAAREI